MYGKLVSGAFRKPLVYIPDLADPGAHTGVARPESAKTRTDLLGSQVVDIQEHLPEDVKWAPPRYEGPYAEEVDVRRDRGR